MELLGETEFLGRPVRVYLGDDVEKRNFEDYALAMNGDFRAEKVLFVSASPKDYEFLRTYDGPFGGLYQELNTKNSIREIAWGNDYIRSAYRGLLGIGVYGFSCILLKDNNF